MKDKKYNEWLDRVRKENRNLKVPVWMESQIISRIGHMPQQTENRQRKNISFEIFKYAASLAVLLMIASLLYNQMPASCNTAPATKMPAMENNYTTELSPMENYRIYAAKRNEKKESAVKKIIDLYTQKEKQL